MEFVLRTHQEKHATAFFHGTTASQEPQDHDNGTHSNQDICSNKGVDIRISSTENLGIKMKMNDTFLSLILTLSLNKYQLGTYYVFLGL